ncbi:hypothetical protein [Acinetobacter phage AB1I1M-1]
MKRALLTAIILMAPYANASDIQMCKGWDKRCLAEQDRRIALDEDIRNHRKMLQGHIDVAVERNNKADEIIRKNSGITPEQLMSEVCRKMAITETLDGFGYLNSKSYQTIYGQCLRGER